MKFCYLDESGTGGDKIMVLAGIVVDAHRMHIKNDNTILFLKPSLNMPQGQ